MSGNNDPFSANIDHVANYISEASMDWVQVINAAQNVFRNLKSRHSEA